MEGEGRFHVVLIPWLAMGHLIPFLELGKHLARRGIQVSLVSTPRNIERLPKVPSEILSLINMVTLPLPHVENLPESAESTLDLPIDKVHYLTEAYDALQGPVARFLEKSVPNWIIYDFAAHWIPPIANKLSLPCAFFSIISAAVLAWTGPPSVMMGITEDPRKTLEDILSVPKWIPFPSNVVYRLHEILRLQDSHKHNASGVSVVYRFGAAVQGSDVVIIRSCTEFEPNWLRLVEDDIYQKPVIPIGILPPLVEERSDDSSKKWEEINKWLNKHKQESVVYVALGSEIAMSQQELTEFALGLELSQLPFFWVKKELPNEDPTILPDGFEDRIVGRGFVCTEWAPQVRILAHPSVGAFLTHSGWSSTIEALGFGRVLILLPFFADQGLNARVLAEREIGLEIPRDERDGSFTRYAVAKSLKIAMVDEDGASFRTKAREMKELFGNKELHERYIDNLVHYMYNYKQKERQKVKTKGSPAQAACLWSRVLLQQLTIIFASILLYFLYKLLLRHCNGSFLLE